MGKALRPVLGHSGDPDSRLGSVFKIAKRTSSQRAKNTASLGGFPDAPIDEPEVVATDKDRHIS